MSKAEPYKTRRFVAFCLDAEIEAVDRLAEDLQAVWGEALDVERFSRPAALLERAEELQREGATVPLLLTGQTMPGMTGMELISALHDQPAYRPTVKILVSSETRVELIEEALTRGALKGILPKPWTRERLLEVTRSHLTDFFIRHASHSVERLNGNIDVNTLSKAYVNAEQHRHAMGRQIRDLQRSFFAGRDLSDDEVEEALIREIDNVFGEPERERIPCGNAFLKEDEEVDSIWVVLEGQVRLTRQMHGQQITFHFATVGRIVGLLAMAGHDRAMYTCTAATDLKVIRLSLEAVDLALQESPQFSIHFITTVLRSLSRRIRRSVELQLEVSELNVTLAGERDQLEQTLHQLEAAQTRLVESEKMATLGQLAAGIGHELNNPVAAIKRAADFLTEDLFQLASGHSQAQTLQDLLHAGLQSQPRSTREVRALYNELAGHIGDRERAKRLVKIGLHTKEDFERYLGSVPGAEQEQVLSELERYYQVGASLKNIRSCGERIVSLVNSIRSYAKPETEVSSDVDVHEGIEDTFLLFGHVLKHIDLHRNFGELPKIECCRSELNQVWTNLISNAIQVMPDDGRLEVVTDVPAAGLIRVRVVDNGHGIPAENLEKIFEVNFTTRQGLTGFGLGIGLPISVRLSPGTTAPSR